MYTKAFDSSALLMPHLSLTHFVEPERQQCAQLASEPIPYLRMYRQCAYLLLVSNCCPPPQAQVQELLANHGRFCSRATGLLKDGRLPESALDIFVVIATLARSGWLAGKSVSEDSFAETSHRMLTEMSNDISFAPPVGGIHQVLHTSCAGLPAASGRPREQKDGNALLISSPPFWGSNSNPRRRWLSERVNRWNASSDEELPIRTGDLRQYESLLDSIADTAKYFGCSAAYIEIGKGPLDSAPEEFAIRIADAFRCLQFSVDIVPNRSADSSWLVLGRRCG